MICYAFRGSVRGAVVEIGGKGGYLVDGRRWLLSRKRPPLICSADAASLAVRIGSRRAKHNPPSRAQRFG